MDNSQACRGQQTIAPSLFEATCIWLKIGLLSFGGPAAQIALMHQILVEEKGWLTEQKYLNALSFCMLLPGPEAMQLATYAGWRLHGTFGGLVAGLLFVLPGACIVAALATIYAVFGNVSLVSALFLGIKATVLIIVLQALVKVSRRALNGVVYWIVATCAFIGIFFLSIPYPFIIFVSALIGFAIGADIRVESVDADKGDRSLFALIRTCIVWITIWILPLWIVFSVVSEPLILDIGLFFSRLAVVTFGGAYAVLAYMGQEVVSQFGWLTAGEMMDGLGLAETTPGPLILVTEFVGYLAGYRAGGIGLALLASLVVLWVTFVPCFLWIFAGAPHIDWICNQPRLKGALTGISAAVVGVILNLSIWFALHVVFQSVSQQQMGIFTLWVPEILSIDFKVVVLIGLCAFLLFKLQWSIARVLMLSAGAGWAITLL